MKVSLAYDQNITELKELNMLMKDIAALFTEERWQMNQIVSLEQVKEFFQNTPILDVLLYDVSEKGAVDYLCELRKEYQSVMLMLIADEKMSPMCYIRPGILASSLLLRPWDRQQAKAVMSEFVRNCAQDYGSRESRKNYIIESKDGILNIPYRQIYFFEACGKRIQVCVGSEEYSFRHTIEELMEELPKQFVRCHRGFIVNVEKIRKVDLSQNTVCLDRGFCIPVARSYKTMIKEYVKNEGSR